MPIFDITGPNGEKFEIEGPNQQGAIDAFRRWQGSQPGSLPQGTPAPWANSDAKKLTGRVQDLPSQQPSWGDQAMSFGRGVIEQVPIVGPTLADARRNVDAGIMSMLHGGEAQDYADQFKAADTELAERTPIARTAGQVTGTVAPLIPLGMTSIGGRLLGTAGSLPSRMGFGLGSGAAIAGADTAARGGSGQDVLTSAGIGGVAGALLPAAGRALGLVKNAVTGQGVPRSVQNVGRALRDDQINPATIPQQLSAMGPGAMVMDLGPNLQRQAGALASVPGQAQRTVRNAVEARGQGAAGRVSADVAATVGTGPDIRTLSQGILAAQKAAADPLYEAVRNVPLQQTGNFNFVFQTPMGQQALREAATLMANDGVQVNGLTVGVIDYAKRALDDIASSASRSGNNNRARQARDLARVLTAEADRAVPQYAQARQAFAGPAAVLDAIEEGTQAFARDTSPAQMQSAFNAMTASEKQAFIEGARSAIEAKMGNAVNDVAALRNFIKSGWNEAKLRTILGPQVADDLIARVEREAVFGRTANAVAGNSETAARQAAQREVAPELGRIHPDGVVGLLFRGLDMAKNAVAGAVQPRTNQQMAQMLAAGNLDPRVLAQLQRGMAGPAPGLLPPGGVALAAQEQGLLPGGPNRIPEIVVSGPGVRR